MNTKKQWLPWTRSCFVCGESNPHGLRLRSYMASDGSIALEHRTREADLGYSNLVHGGISATLLDEVMTWSAIVAMRRPCVAAEMSFRLKHPIKVGTLLRASGKVVQNKRRILLTEGCIQDEQGRILIGATGKYVPMSAENAWLCESDFVDTPEAVALSDIFDQPSVAAGALASGSTEAMP